MVIDEDALGRTVVWDGPYTAYRLARLVGGRAKHAALVGNPHLNTISVVCVGDRRQHLKPGSKGCPLR